MAKHNFGSLGGLTKGDYTTLDNTFKDRNMSLGKIGGDTYGYNVTPQNIVESGIGLVNPALGYGLNIYNDIATNRAVARTQGLPTDFSMAGLKNNFDFDGSRLNSLQNTIDKNKDGKVDPREMQNYGMGRGLTAYNVNLNPMDGYRPGAITKTDITNVNPTGLGITNNAVGSRGNLGGATGAGYTSGLGGFLGFGDSGESEGIDTKTSAATSGSENRAKVEPKFAGTSFSADTQQSGSGGGGMSTYICTALYEMGDMKKSIYKYDQIYGKQVDPATYRGYELWGKYVATKLRKKGIVYKIAKPIALTWANQMAYDLSKGKVGKNSTLIKITKTIGEGACYVLGQIFKRRKLWLKST